MGILVIILLVLLVATVGFWDTLAALAGAALLTVVAVLLTLGVLALGGYLLFTRSRGN
jgi:hypothetical protein